MMMKKDNLIAIERLLVMGLMCDESWLKALTRLAELLKAPYLSVMTRDQSTGSFEFLETLSTPAKALELYEREFSVISPLNTLKILEHTGNQFIDTLVLGQKAIDKSPFYQEFLHKMGISYLMGQNIGCFNGVTHNISIHRGFKERPFDSLDSTYLHTLQPALHQAFSIRQHIKHLQYQQLWQVTVLDTLSFPVLLLNDRGQVLQKNRAAEDWLMQSECPLALHSKNDLYKLQLKTAIQKITKQPEKNSSVVVPLNDPLSAIRLIGVLFPLIEQVANIGLPSNATILMVWSGHIRSPASTLLKQLFFLTQAEIDIAVLLSQGLTINEIAAQRGSALSTVRTQIKTIFDKTYTRRQQDLVRLLTELSFLQTTKK